MTERAMPLKLEVGKTYRNREGEIVRIVGRQPNSKFPFLDHDHLGYREDGSFRMFQSDGGCVFDLIEEIDLAAARYKNVALSCIMTAVEAAHG